MDLPVPADERPRIGETKVDGIGDASRARSKNERPEGRASLDVPLRRAAQMRWRRRYTILVAATGCAGLAVYGVATFRHSRGGSEITVQVPPADRSVAAVQALPPPNLLKPVSPEEATKENAERPFVARPDSPASRFILRTDTDDRSRAVTCLAQAVYYEAAGEGPDGERAVAQVVLNRLRHPGFPSTVCGVVYQGAERPTGCQFSFTCDGSMQRIPVPSLWARSKQIAEQALNGRVFAPVGHATHYHADYVLPYWADSLDKSVQIRRHIFYRLTGTFGEANAFSQHYNGTEPPFREPGATVVIPATPEGQQVANTLMTDGAPAAPKEANPRAPKPDTPLIIDAAPSTLLADGGTPVQQPQRPKKSTECSDARDGGKVAPLSTTDMRAGLSSLTC